LSLRGSLSERIDEFDGEQAGFLREILRAGKVAIAGGAARLIEKTIDLFHEIGLLSVQSLSSGLLKVGLSNSYVLSGSALVDGFRVV
jgi:hypothetical protein